MTMNRAMDRYEEELVLRVETGDYVFEQWNLLSRTPTRTGRGLLVTDLMDVIQKDRIPIKDVLHTIQS